MVGGDHIHRAVQYALEQGFPVLFRSQGRVHLEAPVLFEVVFVQRQVVGRGFARYVHAGLFRLAYDPHALFGRNVANVVGAAGFGGEAHVPLDLPPLALAHNAFVPVGGRVGPGVDIAALQQLVYLAVRHDHFAEALRLLHGTAHRFFALHAPAVVRKGDAAGRERLHIRKRFALFAHRDGGVGVYPDRRVPLYDLLLRGQVGVAVRHGVQVRHGANRRVAAPGRRAAAALYRLFIRKTRLAEMHVHVAKAGKYGQWGGNAGNGLQEGGCRRLGNCKRGIVQ